MTSTGFSSDSGNSDEDDAIPGDSGDDFLSQFKSSKKQAKGKQWTPPVSKSKSDVSPRPSPRSFTGRQTPPKAASRNKGGELHRMSNRSPSPDPLSALFQGSKSNSPRPRERGGKAPVPKPRRSSGGMSDSPRSVEPSPREKPRPSPRLGSFNKSERKSPSSSELDGLLGASSKKPQVSLKKSIAADGDVFVNKTPSLDKRRISPLGDFIESQASSRDSRLNGGSSPRGKGKTKTAGTKSPFTELSESRSIKKGSSRTSPDLDELLGMRRGKTKTDIANDHQTGPTRSVSPKHGKASPVTRRKEEKFDSGESDADKEVASTFKKGGQKASNKISDKKSAKSPDILELFGGQRSSANTEATSKEINSKRNKGKSSPNGKQSANVHRSPKPASKSPDGVGLFNEEKEELKRDRREVKTRSASPKARLVSSSEKTNGNASPLEKLMTDNNKPKKGLLDSDSDEEIQTQQKSPKMSLLDALDGGSPGVGKKKKKQQRIILLDSDEDEQPAIKFTDRRPKGGYESDEDSDLEAELNRSKRLVKPSPQRPKSGIADGRSSLNPSRTLSSMDDMNTLDSSSIRDVMYENWRAQKDIELKRKKKRLMKTLKEEDKKKIVDAEEKRKDASASYEAWKGNKKHGLVTQRKATEGKKKKEEKERKEKMSQQIHATKAFDSWKQDKDEKIKNDRKKKDQLEKEKMMTVQEKEEEKQKDSVRAFNRWNSDKEKKLKKEARDKRDAEEDLKYTQELQLTNKEENGMKAYQEWEEEIEKRRVKENGRLKNMKPISPYPFRPSSNTVPFGR